MCRIPCRPEQKDPPQVMNLDLPLARPTGISNIIDPNRNVVPTSFPKLVLLPVFPSSVNDPTRDSLLRPKHRNANS